MCNLSVNKSIAIITLQNNHNIFIEIFICVRPFQNLDMNEISDKK